MFGSVDRCTQEPERDLRMLGHQLQLPTLRFLEVPDSNEHRPERGDEVNLRTFSVPVRKPGREVGARCFSNEKVGSH